jgi:hypothetical protein
VIEVFAYLLRTSFRNRFTRRIQRLREPRYLVPFVVSLLWFGNFVFRPFLGGSRHVRFVGWGMLPPDIREAFIFLAGLAIFLWIALLWILPDKKAALQFSPAELHFLFPAPITRRQLVQYKLLQAQIGILFGALISSFFAGARFTQLGGWGRLLALWLFFAIGHLHGIGASFVRTDLIEAGWSGVRRRAISIVVVLLFVGGVFLSAREAWTAVGAVVATWFGKDVEFNQASLAALSTALAHAGSHGLASVLLWPFLALPRLLLASNANDFLFYGAVGLEILVIHYLWVINTDTSFEEASLELSQKAADRREARKRTRRTGGILVKKAAPFPWKLKARGRPEIALVWKNVINLTRVTPVRALFALLAFILAMLTWVIQLAQSRDNLWLVVAGLSALIAGFTTVLGPVFLRNDLREDLFRIDSIKTMPLAGHAIVWGEVLGLVDRARLHPAGDDPAGRGGTLHVARRLGPGREDALALFRRRRGIDRAPGRHAGRRHAPERDGRPPARVGVARQQPRARIRGVGPEDPHPVRIVVRALGGRAAGGRLGRDRGLAARGAHRSRVHAGGRGHRGRVDVGRGCAGVPVAGRAGRPAGSVDRGDRSPGRLSSAIGSDQRRQRHRVGRRARGDPSGDHRDLRLGQGRIPERHLRADDPGIILQFHHEPAVDRVERGNAKERRVLVRAHVDEREP